VIEDTIRKVEESLRGDPASPARKRELLGLLGELKSELAALGRAREAEARRIASLARAAHEAARAGGDPTQRRHAADRLAESVGEFEATHPRLTSIVEALAESLASAGL